MLMNQCLNHSCFVLISDGKYHVVPSGDLHVLRSDQGDTSMAYICRVKNILTGLEETSPPFQLNVQDGKRKKLASYKRAPIVAKF